MKHRVRRKLPPVMTIIIFVVSSVVLWREALLLLGNDKQLRVATVHPVAKILELHNDVRVKPAFELLWESVESGRELYPGDFLYTGRDSSARIEYYGVAATMVAGSYSMLPIQENPPEITRVRRTAAMMKKMAIGEAEQASSGRGTSFPEGLLLIRDFERIPLLFPEGNILILTDKYPCYFGVSLERSWRDKRMWGYLWEQGKGRASPHWHGFSKGAFERIPVLKPGEYIFQISTEDETRTTREVVVRVENSKSLNVSGLIEQSNFRSGKPYTVIVL